MDFKNLNIQALAAELGMKDMIIMELQGRIKSLEEALAAATTMTTNGQVEDAEKAVIEAEPLKK